MTQNNKRLADLERAAERLMTSDIVKGMPGFSVPSQERTRLKTCSMLAVAAYFLQTRGFSDITMEEIANAARCSVPSIYARFKNKDAFLPAIHLLMLVDVRGRLDDEIVLERFANKDLQSLCDIFVGIIFDFFEENRNFVVAAILSEAGDVHQQLKGLLPYTAIRLNKIVPVLLNRSPESTAPVVAFAIDLIISLLRDAAVIAPVGKSRNRGTLSRLFALILIEGISSTA